MTWSVVRIWAFAVAGTLLAAGGVSADPVLGRAAALTYCGGKAIKREIAFRIDPQRKPGEQWDAVILVKGHAPVRAMTAFSYFGSTQKPPPGFLVALLGEDRSELLVFSKDGSFWLDFGDYHYTPCNR